MFQAEINYQEINIEDVEQDIWLNPVGGLGDMLMASSVMKLVNDRNPAKKFRIIRRSRFRSFFENHPAVLEIGHPPKDATVVSTMFWKYTDKGKVEPGPGLKRPFQLLAKKFGLEVPIEEKFYYPNEVKEDVLFDYIPWKKRNIILAPSSDSHKKNMNPMKWTEITGNLADENTLVIQVGLSHDPPIKNALNVLGLTTPGQLIALLRRCDLLVGADNFVMHAAHLTSTPAVIIWGPTFPEEFGYPGHVHVKPEKECEFIYPCMGRKNHTEITEYHKPCHLPQEAHCLNFVNVNEVIENVKNLIH